MRVRDAVAAVALAALASTACGSGDDEPAADDGGEPASLDDGVANDDGSSDDSDDVGGDGRQGSAGTGSGRPESVRDDYPVPFPAGWEIDIQGEIGLSNMSGAQLLYPSDAYDDVVAFYDGWFESQPSEFARTVSGDLLLYQLLDPDDYHQVAITAGHEERGETWVLVQVTGGAVN